MKSFIREIIFPVMMISGVAIILIITGITMGFNIVTEEAINKGIGQHNPVTGKFEWITHSDKYCPHIAESPNR
jgi:hypothetical protein